MKSYSRNNLWILIHDDKQKGGYAIWWSGKGYRKSKYTMPYQAGPDWRSDVDYGGFDWARTPTPFWWQLEEGRMMQFRSIEEFSKAIGIDKHAIGVRKEGIFQIGGMIDYSLEAFSPGRLTLKKGYNAIDAGWWCRIWPRGSRARLLTSALMNGV